MHITYKSVCVCVCVCVCVFVCVQAESRYVGKILVQITYPLTEND